MPGWLFEVLPSLHKEVIHNHHMKRNQLLDCCVCMACLREAGYTNAHSTSRDLYHVCPLPKNAMSNSGIVWKSTGIPRTHDWQ